MALIKMEHLAVNSNKEPDIISVRKHFLPSYGTKTHILFIPLKKIFSCSRKNSLLVHTEQADKG